MNPFNKFQLYGEIIQQLVWFALLGGLFAWVPFLKRELLKERLAGPAKFYFAMTAFAASLFLSSFDMVRYNDSSLMFFDHQAVLIMMVGMAAGFVPALFLAFMACLLRWMIWPNPSYLAIVLAASLIGALASRWTKTFRQLSRNGFLAGLTTGIVHGMIVYYPLAQVMPLWMTVASISFVAILEATAVFIFFAVLTWILTEEHQRIVERELLETRVSYLQAQMNPHFLYNVLNTISAVCAKENAFEAQGLVLQISDFFRGTLRKVGEWVTLREEWNHLETYLSLEKARFGERLKIEKAEELSNGMWNRKIPFMILQPIVENAIKHGIGKREEGGRVRLHVSEIQGALKVVIEDNGEGMITSEYDTFYSRKRSAGIGLTNIRERLNRYYQGKARLEFETEKGVGTRVIIHLPANYELERAI